MTVNIINLDGWIAEHVALKNLARAATYPWLLVFVPLMGALGTKYGVEGLLGALMMGWLVLLPAYLFAIPLQIIAFQRVPTRSTRMWIIGLAWVQLPVCSITFWSAFGNTVSNDTFWLTIALMCVSAWLGAILLFTWKVVDEWKSLALVGELDYSGIMSSIARRSPPQNSEVLWRNRIYREALVVIVLVLALLVSFAMLFAALEFKEPVLGAFKAAFGSEAGAHVAAIYDIVALALFIATLAVLAALLMKRFTPTASSTLTTSSKPVVYIRAFADDGWAVDARKPLFLQLHELFFRPTGMADSVEIEWLCLTVTGQIGPGVAVGNPRLSGTVFSKGFPAPRDYISNADWQSHVLEWIDRSALVVAIWGPTTNDQLSAGFAWELEQVRKQGALERLIVLRAPDGDDAAKEAWQRFARSTLDSESVGDYDSIDLTRTLGVCFQKGRAVLVQTNLVGQGGWPLTRSIVLATVAILTFVSLSAETKGTSE